ncbi:MAG: hypothetical protein PHX01_07280 [Clostridia bacterium]|nr:hypothetical protein [Clostridia bacterium]
MFKRYLAIFAVFILTCSLLVGCGASQEKREQPEEPAAPPTEVQTETGKFLGQIDSNSIEIEVNDEAEKTQIQAFQLSEEIKENFSDYNLSPNDKISFSYQTPAEGRPIITEIKKIE